MGTSDTLAIAPASIPKKLCRMGWFIRLSTRRIGCDPQYAVGRILGKDAQWIDLSGRHDHGGRHGCHRLSDSVQCLTQTRLEILRGKGRASDEFVGEEVTLCWRRSDPAVSACQVVGKKPEGSGALRPASWEARPCCQCRGRSSTVRGNSSARFQSSAAGW